jgi:hypothetical protein
MAIAQAGLGSFKDAFARVDGLLERFRESDNPMVQGRLHETRARVALMAGRTDEYKHSLSLMEHWFRGTGTPALIASYERLAAQGEEGAPTAAGSAPTMAGTASEVRTESVTADVKTVVSKRRSA